MRVLATYPVLASLFLLFALAAAAALSRWGRGEAATGRAVLLLAGVGPLCTGWLVGTLLTVHPGLAPRTYLLIVAAVALLPVVLLVRHVVRALAAARAAAAGCWTAASGRDRIVATLLLSATLAVAAPTAYTAATTPMDRSDPLEYATIGRIVARNVSHANYPFEFADPVTNYFWPSTHPLLYVDAIAATYWLQGTSETFGAAKLIAPWMYLSLVLALGAVAMPRGAVATTALMFLGAASPGLVELTRERHVDPLLVYGCFAALLWPAVGGLSRFAAVVHGALIGLAMGTHSIGVLALPLGVAAAGAVEGRLTRRLVTAALVAGLLAGAMSIWPYLDNVLTTGRTVGNAVLDGSDAGIDQTRWIAIDRGLASLWQRLAFGAFRPWTSPQFFGLVPWLAAAAAWIWLRRREPLTAEARSAAAAAALFMAVLVAAALLGRVGPIQNYRYQMVLVPLMLVCSLPVIERWLAAEERPA